MTIIPNQTFPSLAMLLRLPITITALISLAAIVVGVPIDTNTTEPTPTRPKCGSILTLKEVTEGLGKAAASLLAGNETDVSPPSGASNQTTLVHIKIIYANETASGGYLP